MSGYIITLSSIPPRFPKLSQTLERLLRQTVPADRIIVYLPRSYRRFPEWDGTLPKVPDGVEIRQIDQDYGPATKLLPALKEFAPTQEILFCDDDMDYPLDWAAGFLKQRRRKPDACITLCGDVVVDPPRSKRQNLPRPQAGRLTRVLDMEQNIRMAIETFGRRFLGWPQRFVGRRRVWFAGYIDTFQGYGGVLVRPEFFDEDVFDIPEEAWSVDDIWLSGCATKAGHLPWMIPRRREATSLPHYADQSLADMEKALEGRKAADARAARYLQDKFGIWR